MNLSERHLRVLADQAVWQRHCAGELPEHPKVHNRIRKAAAYEYALHQIAGHVNAEGYLAEARDRNRHNLARHRTAVDAGIAKPTAVEMLREIHGVAASTIPACDGLARIRGLIDSWLSKAPTVPRLAVGDAPAGSSRAPGSPAGASDPYGDAA